MRARCAAWQCAWPRQVGRDTDLRQVASAACEAGPFARPGVAAAGGAPHDGGPLPADHPAGATALTSPGCRPSEAQGLDRC